MHPADATGRGLADGTMVRVFNDRGSFAATLRVTERTRQGVAVAPSIWWHRDAPGVQGGPGRNVDAGHEPALDRRRGRGDLSIARVEIAPLA